MFLISCFAIDSHQYWSEEGTEAGVYVFLGLALNVWCPKDTVRKPTTLSAGSTTGKGMSSL